MGEGRGPAVHQEDDGCLQSLGSMHRHDAHFAAPLVHFPLDVRTADFQRGQEALHVARAKLLARQRKGQELVEDFASLRPEARHHLAAHAVTAEKPGIEIGRPLEAGFRPPAGKQRGRLDKADIALRGIQQAREQRLRLAPPKGQVHQHVVIQPEDGTFQCRGQ